MASTRRNRPPRPQGFGLAAPTRRELLGPKIAAADALGLPAWLGRRDWFTAADPLLLELQARAIACGGALPQALGVSPGVTAVDTLRELLWICGHRLEAQQIGDGLRGDSRAYRVTEEPLPAGVDRAQLEAVWMEELKSPLTPASPPDA